MFFSGLPSLMVLAPWKWWCLYFIWSRTVRSHLVLALSLTLSLFRGHYPLQKEIPLAKVKSSIDLWHKHKYLESNLAGKSCPFSNTTAMSSSLGPTTSPAQFFEQASITSLSCKVGLRSSQSILVTALTIMPVLRHTWLICSTASRDYGWVELLVTILH